MQIPVALQCFPQVSSLNLRPSPAYVPSLHRRTIVFWTHSAWGTLGHLHKPPSGEFYNDLGKPTSIWPLGPKRAKPGRCSHSTICARYHNDGGEICITHPEKSRFWVGWPLATGCFGNFHFSVQRITLGLISRVAFWICRINPLLVLYGRPLNQYYDNRPLNLSFRCHTRWNRTTRNRCWLPRYSPDIKGPSFFHACLQPFEERLLTLCPNSYLCPSNFSITYQWLAWSAASFYSISGMMLISWICTLELHTSQFCKPESLKKNRYPSLFPVRLLP